MALIDAVLLRRQAIAEQRPEKQFDASKEITADFRHRALRHHAQGIFMAEAIFGPAITLSTGRVIPTRWVGEQHVREDLGFIPSFGDWAKAIRPKRWMGRTRQIISDVDDPVASGSAAPETQQEDAEAGHFHDAESHGRTRV